MITKLEGPEKIVLTKEKARELSKLSAFKGERPMDSGRLRKLIGSMRDRDFFGNRLVFARVGQKEYRVNGQHTIAAILSDAVPDKYKVDCSYEMYLCDDLKDLSVLFSRFDTTEARRSDNDVVFARQAATPELEDLDKKLVALCVRALRTMKLNLSTNGLARGLTGIQKASLMDSYKEEIIFVCELLSPRKKTKWLQNQYTVWAIIATYLTSRPVAEQFWPPVVSGAMLRKNDIRSLLRENLLANAFTVKRTPMHKFRPYVQILSAWRAYVLGKKCEKLRTYFTTKLPVPVRPA